MHHRRRRRCGAPAGHARRQDHVARARRAGPEQGACRASIRCCPSCRCPRACRWRPSPSAKPARPTPRCSRSRCSRPPTATWPRASKPSAAPRKRASRRCGCRPRHEAGGTRRLARPAGRRPARPHVHAWPRRAWATASWCSIPANTAPPAPSPTSICAPTTSTTRRWTSWPTLRGRDHRVRERPRRSLRWLARHCVVSPAADSVAVAQDRIREKRFLAGIGLGIAPYTVIEQESDIDAVDAALLPGILKRARFGYDGKGQVRVGTHRRGAHGLRALGAESCVLERRSTSSWRSPRGGARLRRRGARLSGGGEPPRQRHSRRQHRAGAGRTGTRPPSARRHGPRGRSARLSRRALRGVSSSSRAAICSPTRSRRGRTTAATTPSTPASPRSSSSRRASCAACRWATRRLHCPSVMVNLLGELWDARRTALGPRAAPPARQAASVRQGDGAPRPQDGPLHRARRRSAAPRHRRPRAAHQGQARRGRAAASRTSERFMTPRRDPGNHAALPPAPASRQGARSLRRRRRPAAGRADRPAVRVRRDPADADSGQGPGADGAVVLLVRETRARHPQPPDRHRSRDAWWRRTSARRSPVARWWCGS